MFRHLSKINFAMYVLTMGSLKEVMEYGSPIFLHHHLCHIL